MSSIKYISQLSADIRMLKEILRRAGYVTSDMKPLEDERHDGSKRVIGMFRLGLVNDGAIQ